MSSNDFEDAPYSWRHDYQLIGSGIASILLLVAAVADASYSAGFYTLVRIVVALTAALLAWKAHQQRNAVTAIANGLLAILFNPIFPIELDRSTWQPVDMIVALYFSWVAMENLAQAKGRTALRLVPAGAVIGLFILVGLASMANRNSVPSYSTPYENLSATSDLTANLAEPAPMPRTMDERVGDAFEAATGVRGELVQVEDGETITTKPLKIVQLPFATALLTQREIKDGCHACTGAIGVFYIKEEGEKTTVIGKWPKAVEGWGWGAAPTDWEMTNKFTANPSIYASGGYTGQGITMQSATLTELTPSGPKTSDVIGTGFTDEGAIVDESEPVCVVEGKIANIRKDRSFDVVVSGSVSALDHYVKKNGRWVKAKAIDWGIPCSKDEAAPDGSL